VAIYFLDTSAVIKRYVLETGTGWVQALTLPTASHSHFLARIAWVETISAMTRRVRGGFLTPANATTALADFRQDFSQQYIPVEISAALIAHAGHLAETYALRGYDAVQLAAASEIRGRIPALILVSADTALNAAAAAEGLPVEDPNLHP
jgi:predicted nucleic acid-binding protein